MSDQGLAIFSPFKVALVFGFTLLAWSDLRNGDQIALMAEVLIVALYLNDLFIQRKKIVKARRLTFQEFVQQIKLDWKAFSLLTWFKGFFDRSTKEARRRFTLNMFFAGILSAPTIMHLLNLTEGEQEGILVAAFVFWSIWFIKTNLKEFIRTKEVGRLIFSNLGVYFLLCSLLLVLNY